MAARNEPNLSSFPFFFTRDPVNRLTKRYTQAWFRRNDGVPIRYRFRNESVVINKAWREGGRRVEEGREEGGWFDRRLSWPTKEPGIMYNSAKTWPSGGVAGEQPWYRRTGE